MSERYHAHRDRLRGGHVYVTERADVVRLDRRVPGDGTRWFVHDYNNGWFDYATTIEPGDIAAGPFPDTKEGIDKAFVAARGVS